MANDPIPHSSEHPDDVTPEATGAESQASSEQSPTHAPEVANTLPTDNESQPAFDPDAPESESLQSSAFDASEGAEAPAEEPDTVHSKESSEAESSEAIATESSESESGVVDDTETSEVSDTGEPSADDETNWVDGTDAEESQAEEPESQPEELESQAEEPDETIPESLPQSPTASPEPPNSAPAPASASRPSSGESQGIPQKIAGTVIPVVRGGTVWTLQTSVRGLDWVLDTLSTPKEPTEAPSSEESSEESPQPQGAVETLWAAIAPLLTKIILIVSSSLSTGMKWGLRKLDAEIPTPDENAEPSRLTVIAASIWSKILPILKQMWRLWQRLLAILREKVLPEGLKRQTDLTLTVLAGGILVSLFWLTSAITPDRPPAPISQTPSQESPESIGRVISVGTQTVDQKRLADIQEQLTAVTEPYGENMVQSVEIDAGGDRLAVTLDADWYRMNAADQDELARRLFGRSQKLSFSNLDILDFEGHRVARSPVIGDSMIIFERTSDVVAEMDRIAAEAAAEAEAAKAVVEESLDATRETEANPLEEEPPESPSPDALPETISPETT